MVAESTARGWLGKVLSEPYADMMRQYFLLSLERTLSQREPIRDLRRWAARREEVREKLIAALGGFPERTPLNARLTGTHQLGRVARSGHGQQGYRIENLVFESRPGFYVTASVYVPEGLRRPAPAILCPHGHWPKGRYQDVVQYRCSGLANRGYIVLCPDAVGYNEREPEGHFRCWHLLAAGQSLQGLMVWDNMRAIDYLCTRPEVDQECIGCTGASGGGNQTMYVSALDERIKASVPVCSVEDISVYMAVDLCSCETVPGLAGFADVSDVCSLIAPRALLMINGVLDSGFPILAARRAAERIRRTYRLYDPRRFAAFESYSGHDYNEEMRRAMYAWFDRWLMRRATEGVEELVEDELLRAVPGGLPGGHATLDSIYAGHARALPEAPMPQTAEDWEHRRRRSADCLAETLGGLPERCDLDVRTLSSELGEGYRLERLSFRSEPNVIVPAVLLVPLAEARRDVTLFLMSEGKGALGQDDAQAELGAGRAVLAFDPRGTGETGCDEHLAFIAATTLGRPLIAMRAWDVLRCLDYLSSREDIGAVRLVGKGSLAASMAALVAAAIDRRIGSVEVGSLPQTLREPYEAEGLHYVQDADQLYMHDILKVGDVAYLAALLAPRPLRVGRLIDMRSGGRVAAGEAWRVARQVYALLGEAESLSLG